MAPVAVEVFAAASKAVLKVGAEVQSSTPALKARLVSTKKFTT